jgi:hypothetical protein
MNAVLDTLNMAMNTVLAAMLANIHETERRRPMSKFYREFTALKIEEVVTPHCAKYVTPAFNGDVEAAINLSWALPNNDRGVIAVEMWRVKVPREAFRTYFESVWTSDHRYV